jgi:hypothetical protein
MNTKGLFIPLVIIVCGGCAQKYTDISGQPAYTPFIGMTYAVTNRMYISGVNAPPGYEKTIDYYAIDPLDRRWDGPEKITEDVLPAGTKLKIKNIRKPNVRLFGAGIESEVEVEPYKLKEAHPIYINLDDLERSGRVIDKE